MPDNIGDALQAAMMHCTDAMVLSDPYRHDCPLVAVNPPFEAVTGYDAADCLGRNCRFLQGPGTDPNSSLRIRACLQASQGCIEWIVNHRRDGVPFWNLLFIYPVRDEAGVLRYYFGHQLDITHGLPGWLADVRLGRAHLIPSLEAEFQSVLRQVRDADRAQALDLIITAAHRLAEITVQLTPGTLEASRAAR